GTDPILGQLNGTPNGGTITFGGNLYQVRYDGGDGNDLTLTANAAPVLNPAVTTTLTDVLEDVIPAANAGTTLDALLGTGGLFADAGGITRPGLAVTGLDSANGTW